MTDKPKRLHLTLLEKNALRRHYQRHPDLTYAELQQWVSSSMGKSIGTSTVGKIAKTPLDASVSDRQVKKRQHAAIEPQLLAFVRRQEASAGHLSDESLRVKASELIGRRIAWSWVQRFKARHGVGGDSEQQSTAFRPDQAETDGQDVEQQEEEEEVEELEAEQKVEEQTRDEDTAEQVDDRRQEAEQQHLVTATPESAMEAEEESLRPIQEPEQVEADTLPDRQPVDQTPPPTERSQLLAMMAAVVANQKTSIESLQTAILSLQQDDLELRRQELMVREQELASLREERQAMEKERRAREIERRAERDHFMALLQAMQDR